MFPESLDEGVIVSRPNRFIMVVKERGGTIRCHCPTTGRLGEAEVSGISCLFSRAKGGLRKTEATVEAVSFDPLDRPVKSWIGINQSAANRYIEFFLRTGRLASIASGPLRREVRLGSSRIDFLVGETFVEVKTPLVILPMAAGAKRASHGRFDSFDRLIRHMSELGSATRRGKKAVIVLCYMYDADPFRVPTKNKYNARVLGAAQRAERNRVETWQVNLRIDKEGVKVIRFFRTTGSKR
jgi:sugar fermentation stimulation protein A